MDRQTVTNEGSENTKIMKNEYADRQKKDDHGGERHASSFVSKQKS